jgi:hypothetical protein
MMIIQLGGDDASGIIEMKNKAPPNLRFAVAGNAPYTLNFATSSTKGLIFDVFFSLISLTPITVPLI